jgi:hypothetical protein
VAAADALCQSAVAGWAGVQHVVGPSVCASGGERRLAMLMTVLFLSAAVAFGAAQRRFLRVHQLNL